VQTSGPRAADAPAPSSVEGLAPSGVEGRAPSEVEAPASSGVGYAHAVTLIAIAALFVWLFARFFFRPLYLAESDLYENGLPIFLSPISRWSSFEFSGLPVFADPQNFDFYLPNMIFGKLLHSWTAVVMSGPLLAACFTYAYVFSTTRSRTAAVLSGLAFGLSEDMLERLRHLNHVHAIAWLPLILLSLDRVRQDGGARSWIAIGAFAVGSCILAGHPQPALYVMYCAGLYALAGIVFDSRIPNPPRPGSGQAESRLWRPLAATAALFAIGILLSSIKAFPLVEARNLVVRSEGLTFERFVGPSLSAPQMFSFVFPTIVHGPTTELPTYVGLATLLLALAGVTRLRSDWRVGFWLVMSLFGVVMGLGTATPLVTAAYYVPLYSWFRNISRHMFLFSFGASVLAGFGAAALQHRQVSPRALRIGAGILAVVMLAGATLVHLFPASFPLEGPHGEPGPGPLSIFTVGVWIQFAILAGVIALASWMVRRPSNAAFALLVPLLVVDLLNALPYDIKADGIEIYGISAEATRPSVHALAIGRALEPTQSRALAIGGTQVDEVLPAVFARAWRIPIAGGYGAMLVDRLSRLATMGTNGEVRSSVLAFADQTLDLLAVKYVIVNADQLEEPERRRWLRGTDRWSEAMHFRTARDTDRGTDEDVRGETEITVFENLRALPRAWLAGAVTPMTDAEAIGTVKSSRLPDGRPFDARTIALIDPSSVPSASRFTPGESDVRVTRIGDGDIGIRVSSSGGGFLVLSENAYPGWRARIDGGEVPIYRTDVTLQGVVVPAGAHRVDFTMEPRSLEAGILVSGLAGLVCIALLATVRQRDGTVRVAGPEAVPQHDGTGRVAGPEAVRNAPPPDALPPHRLHEDADQADPAGGIT
jgi:hypothetical protein